MIEKDEKVSDSDELIFAPEETDTKNIAKQNWKVLIVDDEEDVHKTTTLVLHDFEFENGRIEFLHAYSGTEALQIMKENDNIAVILLDVVMESNHSGLNVAQAIREELHNPYIRIILRTGQPGHAPERKVIKEYDINDYKNKAELSSQQLYTALYSALRSYRDLMIIEKHRQGLQYIINATGDLFQKKSLHQLAKGVLTQIISLVGLNDTIYLSGSGFTAEKKENGKLDIIAATGKYEKCTLNDLSDCDEILDEKQIRILSGQHNKAGSEHIDGNYVAYFPTMQDKTHLLYIDGLRDIKDEKLDHLLQLFISNAGIAFDNQILTQEIVDTQKELIYCLGEVIESRSKETAYHVTRVANYTKELALALGLKAEIAELYSFASPMHDVGKLGIPDSILSKPSRLTTEEYEIMKAHTTIGQNILGSSKRLLLKTAAIIASEHHERWNGNGYPNGLKGADIHIAGRIVCLADIYDALGSKRAYKEPWNEDRIDDFIISEKGEIFDPAVVDAFFGIKDKIISIKNEFKDAS